MWDHFLARHWQQLEPSLSLQGFIQQAQGQILPHLPLTPPRFQNLNGYLWPERWLERYAELPFIGNVLAGMASRRPRLAALAGSFADVERNYHQLETQFWQFYPQMIHRPKTSSCKVKPKPLKMRCFTRNCFLSLALLWEKVIFKDC